MKYYNEVNGEIFLTPEGERALSVLGLKSIDELRSFPDERLNSSYWTGCKSYTDQALKNKKGISWLDDCRVPYDKKDHVMQYEGYSNGQYKSEYDEGTSYKFGNRVQIDKDGRFPANLLVSDDVLNDGRVYFGTDNVRENNQEETSGKLCYGKFNQQDTYGYADSGSFSRYYDLDKWWEERIKSLPENVRKVFPFLIEPKAAKSEKNFGCDGLPLGEPPASARSKAAEGRENPLGKPRSNHHPTVKPIKLMSYLITLGSRENDIILDPFMGSGTTAIAAHILNRKWIGSEISQEYCDIANKRLEPFLSQQKLQFT